MTSPARAALYSKTQADVVELAHRELVAFWATLDKSNPVAAKAALAAFMRTLVAEYGALSATFAADYYDEIREAAGAAGRFTARPAASAPVEQVSGSANWAAQPLFGELSDEAAALTRAIGASQRLVQAAGRGTLIQSAGRDPVKPRFARVPHGDTCDWCIMLASRGAVYMSSESAGAAKDFHDDCDCQPTVSFKAGDLPYDVDAALAQYEANQAKASGAKKPTPGGFDTLTREQVESQIATTEALKDSDWRTKQLARLRKRFAELS